MIDLTPIANAIIALIAALVSAFLIPYLKSKISAAQLAELQKWAIIAVEAAEMIYKGAGRGTEKKEHVWNFLASKGYSLDTDSLDKIIESAVLNLKK